MQNRQYTFFHVLLSRPNAKLGLTFGLALFISTVLSCHNPNGFEKTDSGLEYFLVQHDAGGIEVHPGQYLKLSVKQWYEDTLLRSSEKTGYEYQVIDSLQMSQHAWFMFHKASVGDSMVFRLPVDSAFKGKRPAFVKKNDGWLLTTVKVVAILNNADSVYADRERAYSLNHNPAQ